MSNQEQELTETQPASENSDENPTSNNDEKIEKSIENEKCSSSSENKISNEQEPTTRRIIMPQDIRYSTEQRDRDKLIEKYNNYQVSDTNSCNIRFLIDHRQKKNLLGRNEGTNLRNNLLFLSIFYFFIEENSNLHSVAKTFSVNILVRILYFIFISYIYQFFLSRVIKILQNIRSKFLVQKLMYENVLLKF